MGKKASSNKVSIVALRRNVALGYEQGTDRREDWMGRNVWLCTDHFRALIEANPLDEHGLRQTIKRYNRAIMRSSVPDKQVLLLRLWERELDAGAREALDAQASAAAAEMAYHLSHKTEDLAGPYGDLHIITDTLDRMRTEQENGAERASP